MEEPDLIGDLVMGERILTSDLTAELADDSFHSVIGKPN